MLNIQLKDKTGPELLDLGYDSLLSTYNINI